ncbi:hypothetical protein Cgig2_005181 [Carnegiea gigantea]|uniref:Uncharacterized protein n=1 Tax=Carnegiea gigantea TaxID=171969 RepID=A0A9Q1KDP2_9CARY|nr:hypothetical protein Cgig2_005181 [Carnegiea gigantea]
MNSLGSRSSDRNDDGSNVLLGAELLSAAREGHGGDEIIRILEGEVTLSHVTDPVWDTILHILARAGNVEVATQVVGLVKRHELTEVLMEQNLQGDTPLQLAIANRHEGIALLLYLADSRAGSLANAATVDIELDLVRSDLDESCHSNHHKQEYDDRLNINFYRAIINGREDLVLEALREHPYLASRMLGSMGIFLHVAAKLGQVGVLRLLVGKMTHDEAASLMLMGTYRGSTPLHVALEGNHRDATSYLIELALGAAYQVDKKGVSPLYLAIERGYEDLVKYVFQMIPIAKISRSTLQSLPTDKKASLGNAAIKARNFRWRVFSYAAYKGYMDGVHFLLTNFPNSVKEYDHDGSLPIHKAVGGGHVSIVKELLVLCPETMYHIDKKVKYTKTDVLDYLTKETIEVKKIFSLKDNEGLPEIIDVRDYKGYKGYFEGVRFLLTNFPHFLKKYDQDGSIPLHKAVGGGHVSVVEEFLLHCPHTLYDVDKKGQSILHFAFEDCVVHNEGSEVHEAITTGALDLWVLNNPTMNSSGSGSSDSNDEGSNIVLGAELLSAAREGRGADEIIRILEGDPNLIHVTDPVGDTAIHIVARSGHLEVVEQVVELVEKHKLTEVLMERNVQGDTPLHLATAHRHKHVARVLFQANLMAGLVLNEGGVSPWGLARELGGINPDSPKFIEDSCRDVESFNETVVDIEMELAFRALHGHRVQSFNEDKYTLFLAATLKGQEDLVLEVLREHPDLIRNRDPCFGNILHFVAPTGQVGVLRLLVAKMTPDEAARLMLEGNFRDNTPLHFALQENHKDAARYLIQLAPRAAYQLNKKGLSPLYMAVVKGYEDLVKYVFQVMPMATICPLTKQAHLMLQKASLPHAAIKARNLGILKALMEELPELVNVLDYKGWRVLSYAAYKGYLDGVRFLLTKFPNSVKEYDGDGSLPIHKAVGGGHVGIVKEFLLHCPGTLYDLDKKGQSVLHFAVKYTKILKRDPTLIHVTDPVGDTILHVMARAGNLEVVEHVVGWVRNHELTEVLMEQNVRGDTPLHLAAANRHEGVAHLLYFAESRAGSIANEGGVNPLALAGEAGGSTPLHVALEGNHKDVAGYLIELAPRAAYQVDKKCVSPLYLAIERGYEDLVKYVFQIIPVANISRSTIQSLLTDKKASLGNAAIKARNLDLLEYLMEQLPELINVLDYKGWRVLSYAAYKGYLDGVHFLLTKFPNLVKEYDHDGSLPIHKAVGGGHVSIVKEFLLLWPETIYHVDKKAARDGRAGTEVIWILEEDPTLIHVADLVGDTTLHVVARLGWLEVAELVVGFVKKRGVAEVLMEQNLQGDTPLHVALANRRDHLARLVYRAEPRAASVLNEDGVSPWTLARQAGFDLCDSHDDERDRTPGGIFKAPLLDIEMELVYRALVLSLDTRSYHIYVSHEDKHYLFLEAILDGREDLVLEVLRKHHDLIHYRDARWGTSLHRPANIGQVGMLRMLVTEMTLEEVASMMLEGNLMNNTPLHLALEGYHKDAARYLIDFAPMAAYQVNKKGVSPLYLAVERGYEDIVKYVFQMMPVATISPSTRESLLTDRKASLGHAAIKVRNLGILEALMEELPELINALDYKGWRVLCMQPTKAISRVKEYDHDSSLPIHKAVGGGHVSIVKEFLLHCPETLYGIDKKGQNILHFAVKYTKTDVLTYLTKEVTEVKRIFYLTDNEGEGKSAGSGNEDGGVGAELLAAAWEGHKGDEILRMLEADPTLIHVTDPVGDTALHIVARAGNLEVAEQLVGWLEKQGLTEVLLEQNSQGDTPLHAAAANGHEHVTCLFYKAEFAANCVKNDAGVSPFQLAEEAGFVLQRFHGHEASPVFKADIEMVLVRTDLDESSCHRSSGDDEDQKLDDRLLDDFYWAVEDGREDLVVEALRDSPDLASRRLGPPLGTFLHVAARLGQVGLLRLLVRHMTLDEAVSLILDQDNDNGETALHAALEENHKDAARYLIQLAPTAAYQVNKETVKRSRDIQAGVSPLYLAVEKGHHDIVKCMLQAMPVATISPSTRESLFTPKSSSLVNVAIRARNLDILKALIEELPELVNVLDYKGWRILSYAAYKGYLDGVRYLIKKFPGYIQKYDMDGSLPIHKAVGGGHVTIVKDFLQYCPHTLYAVSKNGQSILHFAVKCAKADVLSYLTKEVTEVKKIFHLKDNKGKTFIDLANELKR